MLSVEPEIFPGLMVQFPEGNPVKTTLPIATEHVGWVIVPTVGAAGVSGKESINTAGEGSVVYPVLSVTV